MRTLDKQLRGIRGHIRSRELPRPDRIVIGTAANTAVIEFTADTAVDRLARLVSWADSLTDPFGAWVLLPNGRLIIEVTGTGPAGMTVSAGIVCPLAKLGGGKTDYDENRYSLGSALLFVDKVDTVYVRELKECLSVARLAARVVDPAGLGAAA